ncbi:hypothetical protein CEN47_09715, partial [Fischerella thermalis CCMEE 5319]
MYYNPSQPPYLLLIIGLFAALTSGLALAGTLKVIVNKWQSDGAEKSSTQLSIKQ